MKYLREWWWLILACVIGFGIGWGLGGLLEAVIDRKIQQAIGG